MLKKLVTSGKHRAVIIKFQFELLNIYSLVQLAVLSLDYAIGLVCSTGSGK